MDKIPILCNDRGQWWYDPEKQRIIEIQGGELFPHIWFRVVGMTWEPHGLMYRR
jgi:hypothetical protein